MPRLTERIKLRFSRGENQTRALVPRTQDAIARGWARLDDSRALIVGGLVLGGAVIWGAAQAGIASAMLYRLFRKRPRRRSSAKHAADALTDTSLRWLARIAIHPTSVPGLVLRIAEVAAISYVVFRAIDGRRRAQGQLATGPRSLALPPAGSTSSADPAPIPAR